MIYGKHLSVDKLQQIFGTERQWIESIQKSAKALSGVELSDEEAKRIYLNSLPKNGVTADAT